MAEKNPDVDQLSFERRELAEKILGEFGVIGGSVVAGVLYDPLAHGKRQIQPAKGRVALLKPGNDAQSVKIMVEAQPMRAQRAVKGFFAGVAKGRMADIVGQCERFGKLGVQS